TQRTIGCSLQFLACHELDAAYPCGLTQVIHDRVGFVESLRRDDVLVGDAFVLKRWRRAVAMKPDVMLPRNLTESLLKWHNFVPLVCRPERGRRISRHSRTTRGPENS